MLAHQTLSKCLPLAAAGVVTLSGTWLLRDELCLVSPAACETHVNNHAQSIANTLNQRP